MDKAEFAVLQVFAVAYGPLSGFFRTEVYHHSRLRINCEYGGYGFGSNYSRGQRLNVQRDDALMLTHSLTADVFPEIGETTKGEDRLLWFRSLRKPVQSKKGGTKLYPKDKSIYTREEIEPYRQELWWAEVNMPFGKLWMIKSAIPGFWLHEISRDGLKTYKRHKSFNEEDRMVFVFEDGKRRVFD